MATVHATREQQPSLSRRTVPVPTIGPVAVNLISGWAAGTAEALSCQPLDTIKVRMQLAKASLSDPLQQRRPTFIRTLAHIIRSEGLGGLYAGLGPVVTFMGPKIAIRFTAFETFKKSLAKPDGTLSKGSVLAAGLAAGVTEAVAVVTPMEVIKVKLQSGEMTHGRPRYYGTLQTIGEIIRSNGIAGLYNGLAMTAARQATNQAVIFSTYTYLKDVLAKAQDGGEVPGWKVAAVGFISGALAPCVNNPLDTIKTRLQKSSRISGHSDMQRARLISSRLVEREGFMALYRGTLPRVLRSGPAQAVSFSVYEFTKSLITPRRDV